MANETPLDNPNVQKFLDFIGKAEGADYNVIVGGKRFDDFSKHPGIVGLRTKEGPSTAAGKYQITKTTYDDFAPKLGITDFSPESQDRIAVEIFKREKALGDIQKGDFEAAINKLGGRFASLPSSKYSQPKKSWDFVQAELGTVAQGPSSTQKIASSAQPKPFKVAQGPQAAPKAAKVALTDLPQSYRSALALNYLVDSDPEDELMAKATELLQASLPDQGGGPAGGTILQKYAAQMPEINPYQFLQPPPTDQEPARMAAGGLVVGGTTLPFVPGASLTQEQMDLIKEREKQYEDYQAKYKEYEPLADAYSSAVDEYNRKVEEFNQRGGASPGEFTQQAPTAPELGFDPEQYEQFVTQAQKDAALRAQALYIASDPGRFNLSGLSAFGSAESPNPVVARRPGAIPRIPRMFANGGEVSGDDLFQQMIGGTPNEPQVVAQAPMTTPMQSEVPQLDQFGRVVRDPVAPVPERSVLQQIIGAGETAATVGTNVLSAVPAALVGAKELLTPGQTRQGAEAAMMGTMERLTYAPRGEAGRENLDNLGKFLQATKLDAALPQTQLMSMRVAPGAARYLGERAREGTEAAVMPGLRARAQNPQLQATDVYGAMLTSPAENIAGAAATYAVKPSGGAVRVEPIISNLSVKVNDAIDNFIESRLIPEGQTNVRQFADEKRKDVRDYASKKFASYYQKAGSPTDPLMQRFIEGKHQLPFESDELVSLIQAEVRDTLKTNRKDAKAGDKQAALELEKMYDMYLSDPMTISYGPQAVINLLNNPENAERFKRELLSQGYVYSPALADDAVNQILRTGRLEFTTDEGYFGDTAVAFSAASAMAKEIADKITAQGGNPNLSAIENSLQTGFRPNRAAELERTLAHEKDRLQKLGQVIETKGASELQLVPLTGTMRKINDLTSEIENLRRGNVVYEFSPDSLFDIEDVADYMVQTPTEKWKNLEVQDLVAAAEKDYPRITDPKKIASRVKRNKKITKEQAFTGTSPVMPAESKTLPGAVWVELSPDATKIEGCMLGHCLQDERYDYAGKIARGQDRIFSLRDKDGKARVTIQTTRFGMDPNAPHTVIKQIKGFSNESVMKGAERKYSKYELEDEVRDFLNEYAADQNRPLTFLEESTHIPPGMSRVFTQKQENDSPVITGVRKRLERMLQLMAPDFEAAGQTSIVTQDANALLKDLREAHANRRPDSEIVTLLYEFTNDLGTSYGYTAKDVKHMLNPFD